MALGRTYSIYNAAVTLTRTERATLLALAALLIGGLIAPHVPAPPLDAPPAHDALAPRPAEVNPADCRAWVEAERQAGRLWDACPEL